MEEKRCGKLTARGHCTIPQPESMGREPEILFRDEVQALLRAWREDGVPPRWQLREQLRKLQQRRVALQIASIRRNPPTIATATIDDGWGHGIETVALCAAALGLPVHALGLQVRPAAIGAACVRLAPHYLALTVLRTESESRLREVVRQVPAPTRVIVGGAFAQTAPHLCRQLGVIPARSLADLLALLL